MLHARMNPSSVLYRYCTPLSYSGTLDEPTSDQKNCGCSKKDASSYGTYDSVSTNGSTARA
eukprot:1576342-Pleurochrysis_carterae.AAC.1